MEHWHNWDVVKPQKPNVERRKIKKNHNNICSTVLTAWFHLYEVQKQAKTISDDKSKNENRWKHFFIDLCDILSLCMGCEQWVLVQNTVRQKEGDSVSQGR